MYPAEYCRNTKNLNSSMPPKKINIVSFIMKKQILAIAAMALMTSCGESLFDTYKDYAGDGEIRYVLERNGTDFTLDVDAVE